MLLNTDLAMPVNFQFVNRTDIWVCRESVLFFAGCEESWRRSTKQTVDIEPVSRFAAESFLVLSLASLQPC